MVIDPRFTDVPDIADSWAAWAINFGILVDAAYAAELDEVAKDEGGTSRPETRSATNCAVIVPVHI